MLSYSLSEIAGGDSEIKQCHSRSQSVTGGRGKALLECFIYGVIMTKGRAVGNGRGTMETPVLAEAALG